MGVGTNAQIIRNAIRWQEEFVKEEKEGIIKRVGNRTRLLRRG